MAAVVRQCIFCGHDFSPPASEVRRNRGWWCSKRCRSRTYGAEKTAAVAARPDRKCSRCKTVKDLECFSNSRNRPAGKGYMCRSCAAEISRSRRPQHAASARRRRAAKRALLPSKPLSKTVCPRCGGKKDFYAAACVKCAVRPAISKACLICGAAFTVKSSRGHKAKYCSRVCQWRSLAEAMRRDVPIHKLRKDNNHKAVVAVLKKLRWAVMDISSQGQGMPDLLIADRTHGVHFVEIKNSHTGYGRKGLSPRQQKWAATWGGVVHVVRNIDDAIELTKKLTAGNITGDGKRPQTYKLATVADVQAFDRGEIQPTD